MQKAIVIGANGQDGTFLVRHLLQKKYRVLGIGRKRESRWDIESPFFSYYHVDLRDTNILSKPLTRFQPDLIFHVAAVHSSAGGIYEPLFADMLKVNVLIVKQKINTLISVRVAAVFLRKLLIRNVHYVDNLQLKKNQTTIFNKMFLSIANSST